jgi:hypothetical protein
MSAVRLQPIADPAVLYRFLLGTVKKFSGLVGEGAWTIACTQTGSTCTARPAYPAGPVIASML